ncbi:MAG TPA: hypothetical protein VMW24_24675 [Sedimentisphaerales bacterium]|nr:hypothetical protein [Sedimentisphaerales bacterium]
MTVSIKIEGLDKLMDTLGNLEGAKYMRGVLEVAGEHVRSKIAIEPPINRNYPLPWASEDQRRQYIAMRRAAGLSPRYDRNSDRLSERLSPSWTTKVASGGLSATIGTKASYARLVQDRDVQTEMHKRTGWVTAQDVVEKESDRIVDMIGDAIDRAMA